MNLIAAPAPKTTEPPEPTNEQLAAAKNEYAKFGATYEPFTNQKTKQTFHHFIMPPKTTDADLKGLPNLPFSFGLNLQDTQVTDAGLKELKELKNLTILNLRGTRVTDVGMKELKNLQNVWWLLLDGTQVTGRRAEPELKRTQKPYLWLMSLGKRR